jgi:hypothetical protein
MRVENMITIFSYENKKGKQIRERNSKGEKMRYEKKRKEDKK